MEQVIQHDKKGKIERHDLPKLGDRTSGILLHPTSLPSKFGIGDLGPEAYRFVKFLKESGQSWWQMLPVGPVGAGNSPYQSSSAFAGNPLLISLERLGDEGLLDKHDISELTAHKNSTKVDYSKIFTFKEIYLRDAFAAFQQQKNPKEKAAYRAFCRSAEFWLSDFALFASLEGAYRFQPWTAWPKDIRLRKKSALGKVSKLLRRDIEFHKFLQFQFFRQWKSLRDFCHEQNIGLIGDIPIFVAYQSAEVWVHRELFMLDKDGKPRFIAGVPPDYFSRTGQRWGNPLYQWSVLRQQKYDWWIQRFKMELERFDVIRLDHFIGFERFWRIPVEAITAETGRWIKGPGEHFFLNIAKALGPLPFIAEDLGLVTPQVTALREKFHFPGMRVLQFAFDGDPRNGNLPHNWPTECVAYTGTHDNETTAGWFKSLTNQQRNFALHYLNSEGKEIHWDLVQAALSSTSSTTIFPMQDILGLDNSARMNRPGTVIGNWQWRLDKRLLTRQVIERLGKAVEVYGRKR